jgi:predicted O-linked N-acetylglucosamine transferase (SPINDLY family)
MTRHARRGRIRIGYASTFLRNHNGAVWLLGWLKHRDRGDFEVFCYHTGRRRDAKTEVFRELADRFHHIPADLEAAARQIHGDDLDVLVHPELGMDAFNMLLASLRLAPIQCVGWGHPVTSGLPTMDCWLSCELMEPEDGDQHYTEKLVRLPNLGHCYSDAQCRRLATSKPLKSRTDLGLPEDRVLYFCSQSLFKYLPQYDSLFPEIARRVPNAVFVFLAISSAYVVQAFMHRIEKAFAALGMEAKQHCIMRPRLSEQDYVEMNRLVDVFLDNPAWSGNNTTLTAVDAGLPVVTLPTGLMRGRHTYGILKMIGLEETIATDTDDYVRIAAQLGTDAGYREHIRAAILAHREHLYNDTACIQGLEDSFRQAVQEGR